MKLSYLHDALPVVSSVILLCAIIHTFSVGLISRLSRCFSFQGRIKKIVHLFSEVEFAFVFWALLYVFVSCIGAASPLQKVSELLHPSRFSEPFFVFAIVTVCSSRPILALAESLLLRVMKARSVNDRLNPFLLFFVVLIFGPLLGSLMSEPAAMTVTALLLQRWFFKYQISTSLKYAILGLLFVNVSIGGVLTPYAAPPVFMVARTWHWDFFFVLKNFAWRGFLACIVSTGIVLFLHRKELSKLALFLEPKTKQHVSKSFLLMQSVSVISLFLLVLNAHYLAGCIAVFVLFYLVARLSRSSLFHLQLKSGVWVGAFLAGIVILAEPQRWWLSEWLPRFNDIQLYFGASALTSVFDNAAITTLGAQVQGLSGSAQYAIVAGAIVGGGLTVIANAPNPAGYSLLKENFGEEGIKPIRLFLAAGIPTLVALIFFYPF